MKTLGALLMIAGGAFIYWALFKFDTTVGLGFVGNFDRVHNLGLMNDQRNYIIIAGITVIVGVLMLLFGDRSQGGEGFIGDCLDMIIQLLKLCIFLTFILVVYLAINGKRLTDLLGIV